MALGDQFKNVYWYDDPYEYRPDSGTTNSLRGSMVRSTPTKDDGSAESYAGMQGVTITPPATGSRSSEEILESSMSKLFDAKDPKYVGTRQRHEKGSDGWTKIHIEKLYEGGQTAEQRPVLQGMLFSPSTGTGLTGDPLLDDSDVRYQTASRALRTSQHGAINTTMSLERSMMPLSEMRKHNIATREVSLKSLGGGAAGVYNTVGEGSISIAEPFSVNPETIVHELGHASDRVNLDADRRLSLDNAFTEKSKERGHKGRNSHTQWTAYDPLQEGVADGYQDVYGGSVKIGGDAPTVDSFGTGTLDNILDSAIKDPLFAKTHINHDNKHVYGAKFPGFKTDVNKALYSAIRVHVGTGGSIEDVPNRHGLILKRPELRIYDRIEEAERKAGVGSDSFNKEGVLSNIPQHKVIATAMLGHLWDTMPHVRDHLSGITYGKADKDGQFKTFADLASKASADNAKYVKSYYEENPSLAPKEESKPEQMKMF